MYGYEFLKKFLHEEGFRMNDEDSIISFKYQGNNYLVFKSESSYLQIVMICNTKNIDTHKLLDVCNSMNSDKFVVKFTVDNSGNVWCSYEFKPTEETSSDDFDTILVLLDKASDELFEKLR